MKVLLDTNIVLDLLLQREPFCYEARELFALIEKGAIEGFLCATTVTTIYYLVAKIVSKSKADKTIINLLKLFDVTTVDKFVLLNALEGEGVDYEDKVIASSAKAFQVDLIITRDIKGFKKSATTTMLPQEFLATFSF